MKRIILFLLLPLMAFNVAIAQKQTLTLEQIFTDRNLYPGYVSGLQPHFSQNYFSYISDDDELKKVDAKGKETVLLTFSDLNAAITAAGAAELKYFPAYTWVGDSKIRIIDNNQWVEVDVTSKKQK
ncbi:MAG: hypothetical protein AB7V36_05055 [Bacteroidales bacterium]